MLRLNLITHESIVREYWEIIDTAEFEQLRNVIAPSAKIVLPNTSEIFHGIDSFIKFNSEYPGRWHAKVEKIESINQYAMSITKVWNDDKNMSFYVTSIFEISNNKINKMEEYWSENGPRPEWRSDNRYTYEE